MNFGSSPTGTIVNLARVSIVSLGLFAIGVSIIGAVWLLFTSGTAMPPQWQIYACIGLFIGGVILVALSASYKIQSHPWLLPNVVYDAVGKGKSVTEVESIVRALEAHVGTAGFFNRIGFSGLSLGTIASAFILLLLGLFALQFQILEKQDFAVFADLSKLLFGAFVGSFATQHSTLRRGKDLGLD